MKSKWLLILFAAVLTLSVVASAASFNPNVFVYVGAGDCETLDPSQAYDTASSEVINQCYDNLLAYKTGTLDQFVPSLATKVPSVSNGLISADGKTYTFPIRKGVKFHNGAILTPEDVAYTFHRNMLEDPAGGPNWMLVEPLLGVTSIEQYAMDLAKVDDFAKVGKDDLVKTAQAVLKAVEVKGNNVVFHLVRPYPPFLSILAHNSSWSSIFNQKWMIAGGDWDGKVETWTKWHNLPKEQQTLFNKEMGTGPYVHIKWDQSAKMHTFEAFKGYWRGQAKIKTAIINNGVTEFNTRKLMLQQGEADAIYVPTEYLPQVEAMKPNVTVLRKLPWVNNTAMLFVQNVNAQDNDLLGSGKLDGNGIPANFFSDVNVRRAFCYAFDYNSYINQVALGEGSISYGPIPSSLKAFFDPKMEHYSFNLKKAAEYFKKAFNGEAWDKGFKLIIVYNIPNTSRKTAAEILKTGIESISPKFKVEVQGMEWPTMLGRRKENRLPILIIGWLADYADPHNFVNPYLSSTGDYMSFAGEDGIAMAKKEFDPLIEAGMKTTNRTERIKIYTQLQKKAFDLAPELFYNDALNNRVMRSWVKGYVNDPINPANYNFYDIYKSQKSK